MRLKNLVKTGVGVVGGSLFGLRTPLKVAFSVTNRCDLECVYCNYKSRPQKELTKEQIFNLIDQMANAGVEFLGLFGGEPLIRDDIGEIVSYANHRRISTSLVTNGMLLRDRREVLEGLDLLIVSLDGPEEIHDKNRGKGSFKKALEAIELAGKRIPVWTITTLTNNNVEEIDYILNLARRMRFGATFQFLYHNEYLGRNHKSLMPSHRDCIQAVEKLFYYKRRGYPVVSSLYYLKRLLKWPDFSQNILFYPIDNLRCAAGKFYCSIDTDGTVYPCSVLIKKREGKNFLKAGFSAAFHSLEASNCTACLSSCMTDHSYMFSLKAIFILDVIKKLISFRPKERLRFRE